VSGIFAFNRIRRRLSNAVAELGTRCPCKSLKQRHCCRETWDRNGADTRCDRKRKSIKNCGKDSQAAIFFTIFQMHSPMERRVIRDRHEASMPPRISQCSIRATHAIAETNKSTSRPKVWKDLLCIFVASNWGSKLLKFSQKHPFQLTALAICPRARLRPDLYLKHQVLNFSAIGLA
jgi:hypothetical protein